MKFNHIYAAMLVAGIGLSASAASAAELELKYSSWLPPTSWVNTDLLLPYFDEVERVTDGRVAIEMLPKTVGTAASQFDVVREGLADVTLLIPGYTPGRFVTTELGELPFLETNSVEIIAPLFHRLFEQHLQPVGEYDEVKVLSMFLTSSGHVFNRVRPIEKIEDWQGLKIRSVGTGTTASLEALGAVPITKPSSEVFEMLTTGALDGSLSGPENLVVSKMVEVVTHGTIIPGGMYHAPVSVIMNKAAWEKISSEDQAAITAISGDVLAKVVGQGYDRADSKALETAQTRGTIHIVDASDELVAAMKEKTASLEGAWIERAKAAGLADPAAILTQFRADIAAAEAAKH